MNRKGFTLVELLATITILGILATISVVAVGGIIHKSKVEYYRTLKNTVESAARDYYNDHRILLPETTTDSREVTVQTLMDNKYMTSFKDTKKNDCNKNSSKVKVTRVSLDNYKYEVTLVCSAKDQGLIDEAK